MDVPEGNIRAKIITAENLNIELGCQLDPHQQVSTNCQLTPGITPKLKIYNQATLPQKIQYWHIVGLSIGSLISYGATVLSSIRFVTPQCNCTAASTVFPKWADSSSGSVLKQYIARQETQERSEERSVSTSAPKSWMYLEWRGRLLATSWMANRRINFINRPEESINVIKRTWQALTLNGRPTWRICRD